MADSIQEVAALIPTVRKFVMNGPLDYEEYREWWEILLCVEIARKCGMKLLCKHTEAVILTKKQPCTMVWFSSISFVYINGVMASQVPVVSATDIKLAILDLLSNMNRAGILPQGFRKLCARPEFLRPVVLIILPYLKHLIMKLVSLGLTPGVPGDLRGSNLVLASINAQTAKAYYDQYNIFYWSDQIFIRIPMHVNSVKLWAYEMKNIKLNNEDFRKIYVFSGRARDDFTIMVHALRTTDPQLNAENLLRDVKPDNNIKPHPFVVDVPKDMMDFVELRDVVFKPDEIIDFVNGTPCTEKSTGPPTVNKPIEAISGPIQAPSVPFTSHNRVHPVVTIPSTFTGSITPDIKMAIPAPTLVIPFKVAPSQLQNNPAEIKPTIAEADVKPTIEKAETLLEKTLRIGAEIDFVKNEFLIENVMDSEAPSENQIVKSIMMLSGCGSNYQNVGRLRSDEVIVNRPLIVRIGGKAILPNMERLQEKMNRVPELSKYIVRRRLTHAALRRIEAAQKAEELRKKEKEKEMEQEKKRIEAEQKRQRSIPKPEKEVKVEKDPEEEALLEKATEVTDRTKEKYAARIRDFLSQLADSIGMNLFVEKVIANGIWKCQMKLTGVPYMLIGGCGLAPKESEAETVASVNILAKLVHMGVLQDSLTELISNYEQWSTVIVAAIMPLLEYMKILLRGPLCEPLIREVEMWENTGAKFTEATRNDQEVTCANFAKAIREFSITVYKNTTLRTPEGLYCPEISGGSLRFMPSSRGYRPKPGVPGEPVGIMPLQRTISISPPGTPSREPPSNTVVNHSSTSQSTRQPVINDTPDVSEEDAKISKLLEEEKALQKELDDIEKQIQALEDGPQTRSRSHSRDGKRRSRSRSRSRHRSRTRSRSPRRNRKSKNLDSWKRLVGSKTSPAPGHRRRK